MAAGRGEVARARLSPPEPREGEDEAANGLQLFFEQSLSGARERFAETSEARAQLAANQLPPLEGAVDLDESLRRVSKRGVLTAHELLDVRATLAVLHATARFLRDPEADAPRLANLAEAITDQHQLERDIGTAIDPSGELRDTASPELRRARADAQRLGGELQQLLERFLKSPSVAGALSDRFYTMRNDRYVLPVRADARGKVKGIVHDASA